MVGYVCVCVIFQLCSLMQVAKARQIMISHYYYLIVYLVALYFLFIGLSTIVLAFRVLSSFGGYLAILLTNDKVSYFLICFVVDFLTVFFLLALYSFYFMSLHIQIRCRTKSFQIQYIFLLEPHSQLFWIKQQLYIHKCVRSYIQMYIQAYVHIGYTVYVRFFL